jgi:hypothetical protein
MAQSPRKTTKLVIKGDRHDFRIATPEEVLASIKLKKHSKAVSDPNQANAVIQDLMDTSIQRGKAYQHSSRGTYKKRPK